MCSVNKQRLVVDLSKSVQLENKYKDRLQQLINLEIPVLARSLKSSNGKMSDKVGNPSRPPFVNLRGQQDKNNKK